MPPPGERRTKKKGDSDFHLSYISYLVATEGDDMLPAKWRELALSLRSQFVRLFTVTTVYDHFTFNL